MYEHTITGNQSGQYDICGPHNTVTAINYFGNLNVSCATASNSSTYS